ncbi:peptide deformylase [candidate division LCP-89 bacterium B3_LCP]|uniref:Peptide deformylase n=1 Tax=candidate division LCP-89 bacterium B3_LCP TaxID=2012998 RepID=A0A532V3I1_UNCL8|nr:MAG: peptide deformylase [candidate division LCP-89 bacterium B3_LCP]
MSADNIRIYGDEILRLKAAPVVDFNESLKATVEDMFDTMQQAEGIGLAAPQVGISQAFLIVGLPHEDDDDIDRLFFANPKILETDGESHFEEGCLSVPGITEDVVRPQWIKLECQDIDGKIHTLEDDGLLARVLQHEIDHINGILFIDRLSPARKSLLKNTLKKIARREPIETGSKTKSAL